MFQRPSCCRYVIKELVHAFSCAYIELWMHLGSLESTQEARVAPRATLTLLSCSPNFPRASITRYTHAKHEPILKLIISAADKEMKLILSISSNCVLTFINASAAVTLLQQRPDKIQAMSEIWTHDLRDASAVLSQLSYQSHTGAIVCGLAWIFPGLCSSSVTAALASMTVR